MKNSTVHAYSTLVRIRVRRQEALDHACHAAQAALEERRAAARDTAHASSEAENNVHTQTRLIEHLTRPGSRFQIADYLAQLDYQTSLEKKVGLAHAENERADNAVKQQAQALQLARTNASMNMRRRERLEERIRTILLQRDIAQMDADDEEAEEAVVTRKFVKTAQLVSGSDAAPHA